MRERADKTMLRPKLIGTISAESVRELYRKHTAKQMAIWIAARDGLDENSIPKKLDKPKLFKEMYPVLCKWMEEKGFCIKSKNVTAKARAALALAVSVQVKIIIVHVRQLILIICMYFNRNVIEKVAKASLKSGPTVTDAL